MQTEAAPREIFTLSALFRYKLTIIVVATLVILGGYLRIITQPKLYEATARMAVRFSSEALQLGGLKDDSLIRLPLLEEEVKANVVLLRDPQFLDTVFEDFDLDAPSALDPGQVAEEPSMADKLREQVLSSFYSVRKTILGLLDSVLFYGDNLTSQREQKVNQILSRLEITSGTEASHIITVSYRNIDPSLAEQVVNTIVRKFVAQQKKKVRKKDETIPQELIARTTEELVDTRKKLLEIADQIGSPTVEEAVQKRYETLELFEQKRQSFLIALRLLEQGVTPFDKELPLESSALMTELEREYFGNKMRLQELGQTRIEVKDFFTNLAALAQAHMVERKKEAIERDKLVIRAQIEALEKEIVRLKEDTTLADLSTKHTQLTLRNTLALARLTQAETDLRGIQEFNAQLGEESVAETIKVWQEAKVPSFPLPQYRGIKLLVVIVLGLFAGLGAALLRHQLSPRPARRPRARSTDEVDVPLILLPDDGKRGFERDLEIDISFPPSGSPSGPEGAGKDARRS